MIWPFRPPQTPPDTSEPRQTVLDLIEQVAMLRGQVRAMESEWDDIREQIKKGYQRIEKANQRAEKRLEPEEETSEPVDSAPYVPLVGFAKKLHEMKG